MTKHHMPAIWYLLALAALASHILIVPVAVAAPPGSTPVRIINPEDIAKAEGIGTPFQDASYCDPFDQPAGRCAGVFTVPAGTRWVIELVTYFCRASVSHGELFLFKINTRRLGLAIDHYLSIPPPTYLGTLRNYSQAQPVRLYADAASGVTVTAQVVETAGTPECFVTLSGQAVTVP